MEKINQPSQHRYNETRDTNTDTEIYDNGQSWEEEECEGKSLQWGGRDSIVTDVLVEAIFICGK